ncbi:MAG: hypothetical protein ACTSSG_12460 [Candidatus Heimdallarchaeaceae archaeon]
MEDESENRLRFILEKILCIEDSSQISVHIINIIEGGEWKISCPNDDIRFLSKSYKSEGINIDLTHFRKIYSGATRRKLPIIHVYDSEKEISGSFLLKLVARIWKLTIREKLLEIKLIPFEDEPFRAKYMEIEFTSGIFIIKSLHQLFPTNDYFEKNVYYSKKYAKAYEDFKRLVPFTIDRIIDLLSTDEIAPTFEAWKANPLYYDIPGVDTANITLAKKLADELPAEELNILIKEIREIMTETDWEEYTDTQTIERYSKFLKYVKKLRKMKKKDSPEDYSFVINDN